MVRFPLFPSCYLLSCSMNQPWDGGGVVLISMADFSMVYSVRLSVHPKGRESLSLTGHCLLQVPLAVQVRLLARSTPTFQSTIMVRKIPNWGQRDGPTHADMLVRQQKLQSTYVTWGQMWRLLQHSQIIWELKLSAACLWCLLRHLKAISVSCTSFVSPSPASWVPC